MQLTTQVAGRKAKEVWRNGSSLVIRFEDGYELRVGWKNADTGMPVNGEPVILFAGKNVMVRRKNLIEIPHRVQVGL